MRHVASKLPSVDTPASTGVGGEEAPSGSSEEARSGELYEQVAWPLGKIYGHPYGVFELIFICSEQGTVFSLLANPPSPPTISALTSAITRRHTPQPIKLWADIELTFYTPAGIGTIKKGPMAEEKESNETVPIKAKLAASPLYVLSTNATDKFFVIDCLERAIESVQGAVKSQFALVVKLDDEGTKSLMFLLESVHEAAVSETDEQDLAQLMAKVRQENAEVPGDKGGDDGI